MFDELPIDITKFKNSEEAKRLLDSLIANVAIEMKKEESGIGLAMHAIFNQLTSQASEVMNQANFSAVERQLITMMVRPIYEKLKG